MKKKKREIGIKMRKTEKDRRRKINKKMMMMMRNEE